MTTSRLNFAAIIKERVSSREMLESVGVHVNRRGMAKCPFHADKDASLKVYSDARRGWHCYGCNVGGDATDFAMMWYGISFKEALSRLNESFNLGLPIGEPVNPSEMREIRADIERRRKEREAKKKACDEAEAAYWAAFERWLDNVQTIRFERPRSPQEPMSEAFVYAVTHSAEILDSLQITEERWRLARAAG